MHLIEDTADGFEAIPIKPKTKHYKLGDGGSGTMLVPADMRLSDFMSNCPGHVASDEDRRVCGRCGTHVDSERAD